MAFVRRLRRETGLPVKVITGAEEARLIFRAAQHALGLHGGPHLLLDVGGEASSWCSCTRAARSGCAASRSAPPALPSASSPSDPPTARQVAPAGESTSSASWARSSPRPARGRGARDRHLGDREHAGRDGGGGARARICRGSTARARRRARSGACAGACSRSRPAAGRSSPHGREARRPDCRRRRCSRNSCSAAPAPRS